MKTVLMLLLALPLAVSAAAEKIVSLGGDVTGIVYGLGAQAQLVGRDSTSTWPAQAQTVPDVGYLRQLNAEGILSLRPTVVLASAQAQPSQVLQKVQENHVRVVSVPGGYTLADIDKKVALIAAAIGRTAAGDAVRKKLAAEIAALPAQPVNKRVLFILSHGGDGCRAGDGGGRRYPRGRFAECDAGLCPLPRPVAGRGDRQQTGPGGDLRRRGEKYGW